MSHVYVVPYLVGGFKFQPIWKDMHVQNGFIFPKWLGVNIQNVIWNHLPRYSWLVNYGWCETLGLGLDHPNPLRVEPTHFRYSDTIQLTHNAETRKLLGGFKFQAIKKNMRQIITSPCINRIRVRALPVATFEVTKNMFVQLDHFSR